MSSSLSWTSQIWVCLFCLATSLAAPAPRAPLELDIIDMAAISRMTPQQLEVLAEGLAAEEIMRTKRSSAQALSAVASKAASGIQSKLGLLGQASAGAASFVASASSKSGHGEEHGYSYEPHDEKVDYWGLKKSILYTLFQAVKAITGGVTILKGQLIKGGGALAASLGRVISSKGDVVSNIGKKIVSSAALSHKKPVATVVYGPPSTSHVEYGPPPSAYAAPTAPAHYPHTSSALSAPTGFAAHKYPSHIDGRGKLAGVHAGVVILAPLGDAAHGETHQHSTVGHTPLEPPPSILNTVYTAVKDVFSSASPSVQSSEPQHLAIPPPPLPDFKPMSWGAVDSYGEPASTDAYLDYDPRNPQPTFAHATSKHSIVPTLHKKEGLTPAKIQKINRNLSKLAAYMNNNVQRSLDVAPQFNKAIFEEMLMKTGKAFLPTPTSDNDVGVLPAELLPDLDLTTSTTSTTTTTTTPRTTTDNDANRRKDVKFFLRGNKIVQV